MQDLDTIQRENERVRAEFFTKNPGKFLVVRHAGLNFHDVVPFTTVAAALAYYRDPANNYRGVRPVRIHAPDGSVVDPVLGTSGPAEWSNFTTENGIKSLLTKTGWAIVSAYNPQGETLPEAENIQRNETLLGRLAVLKGTGQVGDYETCDGFYNAPEKSAIIIGLRDTLTALDLGAFADQETVLLPEGLREVQGEGIVPAVGVTVLSFGQCTPDSGEYWSRLPGAQFGFRVELDFGEGDE